MLPLLMLLAAPVTQTWALDPPDSAEVCGRCHRAIHEAWKSSAHARAMDSRLFQDALELAERDFGADARRTCLGCHAPVAARIGDLALRRKVSWEGVTCDFCHSIQDVSLDGSTARAMVEFSLVKSGPLKDASSSAHGTAYSEVHTTSAACAACHEYRNAHGFEVLTTFSEWKSSPAAAEGKPCQACHMYRVSGNVVDPRIQRSSDARVNLHQIPGSHSVDQLIRTITANMTTAREPGGLRVNIEVTNRAAGHHVPTGSALRQLVLEVRADTFDGHHFQGERLYRRVVADQQGHPIEQEHLVFLKAAKTLSDTRLASGEKRVESFLFPVASNVAAQVKATFWYHYSPMARTEAEKRLSFLTLRRFVK